MVTAEATIVLSLFRVPHAALAVGTVALMKL